MQYIIHDLIKLPLADRLCIIEKVISSIGEGSLEQQLLNNIAEKVKMLPSFVESGNAKK